MTIYALVSALEEDLRDYIKQNFGMRGHEESIFDQNLMNRAKSRLERDIGIKFEDNESEDLIDYFDLGDTFQFINSNSSISPGALPIQVKKQTKNFEKLVPIRNRVMHIRPLDFDDLPFAADFCNKLFEESPENWENVKETLERLEADPSFVLALRITTYEEDGQVFHNLPLPDFDETGLIGRDTTVKQIMKLCRGSFPVISIVGEGGVGKTALALKVAYELLEEKNLFDAVVWVSSKTTQITVNEIRDIRGAINSSIGVVQEISDQLIGKAAENPLEEIAEYLATFKVALFIDNLETVLDDNIREFVSALPNGSKLIITSRIGLGAFEYPVKLNGIEESYASQLIRALARIRNVQVLARLEENVLRKYANRMHLSPGYIKWFVSAVQTGLTPEDILQNSQLFLEFCMSNVYDYLSPDARAITSTLQCAPGWKDVAELAHLTDFEAIRTQKALKELMATNMLAEASKAFGGSVKTTYQLSELPRAYLNKHHRPSNTLQERIKTARNKLNARFDTQLGRNGNKYNINNIVLRVKNDRVIIKTLSDALKFISTDNYDSAYELLEEARRLAPDFFEVHRVIAYFQQKKGNFPEARDSFELAITLSPNTPQLHFWFGKFLLRDEEVLEDAVEQFLIAHRLDRESLEIGVELARVYMFQKEYGKSWEIVNMFFDKQKIEGVLTQMLADIKLQLHYREADSLAFSAKYSDSLEKLKLMVQEYEGMPARHRDVHVRKKLTKALPTVSKLIRNCNDFEREQAVKIQDWLHLHSRK
jgi:tetratricopeptide (TPR) repeat protein